VGGVAGSARRKRAGEAARMESVARQLQIEGQRLRLLRDDNVRAKEEADDARRQAAEAIRLERMQRQVLLPPGVLGVVGTGLLWDVSTLCAGVPPPGLYGVVGTGLLWDVSTLCAGVPPPGVYGVVGTGLLWDVSVLCVWLQRLGVRAPVRADAANPAPKHRFVVGCQYTVCWSTSSWSIWGGGHRFVVGCQCTVCVAAAPGGACSGASGCRQPRAQAAQPARGGGPQARAAVPAHANPVGRDGASNPPPCFRFSLFRGSNRGFNFANLGLDEARLPQLTFLLRSRANWALFLSLNRGWSRWSARRRS
jgi:hypothetical protein